MTRPVSLTPARSSRIVQSLRRRVSAADHGKRRGGKELRVAGNIEQGGGSAISRSCLGYSVSARVAPCARAGSPSESFFDFGAARSLEDAAASARYDATELRSVAFNRRLEDRRWKAGP